MLLQLIVFSLIYPNLWYGPHDISDITIYFSYAAKIASGLKPYKDFAIEYPPLAVPLFTVAGNGLDFATYQRWFSFEMFVFTLAAAAAVVAAAAAIWRRGPRPFAAAASFALFTAAMGAIVENRFDIVVALSIALCIWLLAVREYELAGLDPGSRLRGQADTGGPAARRAAARGLEPACALDARPVRSRGDPALRALAGRRTQRGGALVPLPPRPSAADRERAGNAALRRAPRWVGCGSTSARASARRASTPAARPSWRSCPGPLTLLALALTYALVARRRALLRAAPRHLPLAVFATACAFMVFGKVLSPQYFIWLLPAAALVLLDDIVVGLLALATVVLTQVEFPGLYWSLVYLDHPAIGVLVVRDLLLLATFVAALVRLWRLWRAGAGRASTAGSE